MEADVSKLNVVGTIMGNFDFELTFKVINLLDIRFGRNKCQSVDELKSMVKNIIINSLVNKQSFDVGGIRCEYRFDENANRDDIRLSFVVTDIDTGDYSDLSVD